MISERKGFGMRTEEKLKDVTRDLDDLWYFMNDLYDKMPPSKERDILDANMVKINEAADLIAQVINS